MQIDKRFKKSKGNCKVKVLNFCGTNYGYINDFADYAV